MADTDEDLLASAKLSFQNLQHAAKVLKRRGTHLIIIEDCGKTSAEHGVADMVKLKIEKEI
jgi:hypothetical protein